MTVLACTVCDSPAGRQTREGLAGGFAADLLAVGLPLLVLAGCAAAVRFAPLPAGRPTPVPSPLVGEG